MIMALTKVKPNKSKATAAVSPSSSTHTTVSNGKRPKTFFDFEEIETETRDVRRVRTGNKGENSRIKYALFIKIDKEHVFNTSTPGASTASTSTSTAPCKRQQVMRKLEMRAFDVKSEQYVDGGLDQMTCSVYECETNDERGVIYIAHFVVRFKLSQNNTKDQLHQIHILSSNGDGDDDVLVAKSASCKFVSGRGSSCKSILSDKKESDRLERDLNQYDITMLNR